MEESCGVFQSTYVAGLDSMFRHSLNQYPRLLRRISLPACGYVAISNVSTVAILWGVTGSGSAQYRILLDGIQFVTSSDDTDSPDSRQSIGTLFCRRPPRYVGAGVLKGLQHEASDTPWASGG